jgi:hypothetical protein
LIVLEAMEQAADPFLAGFIQTRGRHIQQQHIGPADERERKEQSLELSA